MRALIAFVAVLLWQTIVLGQSVNSPPYSVPAPVPTIAPAPVKQGASPTVAEQEAVSTGTVDSYGGAPLASHDAWQGNNASSPTIAEQMLERNNALRAAAGKPPQILDPRLCQAAQSYADYLAATRQQGHYANGSPEQRAKAAGFTGSLLTPGRRGADGWTSYGVGEVLAFGHPDIAAAFDGWMHSPGHRAAVLESSYDVAGFGRNGTVWIGMFGNSTSLPSRQVFASQTSAASPPPAQVQRGSCAGGQCFAPSGFTYQPAQQPRQYVPQRRQAILPWRR